MDSLIKAQSFPFLAYGDPLMANSLDGATDGAIQDILWGHTQNYRSGAFWDFRPPHFEGVWRVPIYIGPPEWNVGESRGALLKS